MHKKTLSSAMYSEIMIVATSRNGQPCKTDKRPPFSNPANRHARNSAASCAFTQSGIYGVEFMRNGENACNNAGLHGFLAEPLHPEHVATRFKSRGCKDGKYQKMREKEVDIM